jgi:NitT/TauT family transport system substrate-binding protein
VLADAAQPLMMLKYAARLNGVDWASVNAVDAGTPEDMARAFRQGRGVYVHLQSPAAHQLECDGAGCVVSSVGASMPPVAFSSLCCSRDFATTDTFRRFVDAYAEAREWVHTAPAQEVARVEASFFEGIRWKRLRWASSATGHWAAGTAVSRFRATSTSRL